MGRGVGGRGARGAEQIMWIIIPGQRPDEPEMLNSPLLCYGAPAGKTEEEEEVEQEMKMKIKRVDGLKEKK